MRLKQCGLEARPRARAVQYLFLQNKANFPAISQQPPQFFIRTTNPEMPDFADSVKKPPDLRRSSLK